MSRFKAAEEQDPGNLANRPVLFWERIKFDESEKRMAVDFCSGLSRAQRTAKWSIGVAERWIGWRMPNGEVIELCAAILVFALDCWQSRWPVTVCQQ